MEINKAQEKVKELFENIQHPRLASYIALTEEVGELANEIMKKEIYKETSDDKELKGEMADVLVCLLELADVYNINLQEEFENKIKDLEPRCDKWKVDLKDIMIENRKKLD